MATLKRCLGVDLGSNTVKVAEVAIEKSGVRILRAVAAETNIEPGASPEERRTAVTKVLREILRKNKITTKKAVFALPGQKVFIRRFRLPETTPDRLERIVRFEAHQQIPFPLDKTDLQWQFFPIPEEKEVEVLLVAVRHEEVSEFMAVVDKTGLNAVAVAVSTFALFNTQTFLLRSAKDVRESLEAKGKKKAPKPKKKSRKQEAEEGAQDETEGEGADGAEASEEFVLEEVKGYVNIGAGAMDLAIGQHGRLALLKFPRSVPTAGNEITRSIMENCRISSFLDAERIKKHQTRLMTFDFDFDESGDINHDACAAATQTVDRIVSELRRSLDFFISQPDGMAVDTLILSGGQAMLKGMDTYIEEKLTLPVTVVAEPEGESALAWPAEEGPLPVHLISAGLALQGIGFGQIVVDFLPETRKIIRDFPYRSVVIMAAVLLLVILVSSQGGSRYTELYQEERTRLQAEQDQRREQDEASTRAQTLHADVAKNYETFNKMMGQRTYWVDFMARVASVKPPEVLIERMTLGPSGEVTITGLSETKRSASDFNKVLKDIVTNPLREPNLEQVESVRDPRYDQPVERFRISLQTSDKVNTLRIDPATGKPQGLILPSQ